MIWLSSQLKRERQKAKVLATSGVMEFVKCAEDYYGSVNVD